MYWDQNNGKPGLDELDDDHADHCLIHRLKLAQALDSGELAPITLTRNEITIFQLSIMVLEDVLAATYIYPRMNVRREATARICFCLGSEINERQDAEFTTAALTFVRTMTADLELIGAIDDALLEQESSKASCPLAFIEQIQESNRSGTTRSLLAGLNLPSDASTMYFPVQEGLRWL